MPEKEKLSKTEIYKQNLRTFFITELNLKMLSELTDTLFSEPTLTKMINFALDNTFKPMLEDINKAKNPADKNQLIIKYTKEVKEYASTEETFR